MVSMLSSSTFYILIHWKESMWQYYDTSNYPGDHDKVILSEFNDYNYKSQIIACLPAIKSPNFEKSNPVWPTSK